MPRAKKTSHASGKAKNVTPILSLDSRCREERKLLKKISATLKTLGNLLEEIQSCDFEDAMYRFYHQSFKVYYLQYYTEKIVKALQGLATHLPLNASFMEIIEAGTGKVFTLIDNKNWTAITRPIIEAFCHSRYFLEMVCKYGRELKTPPQPMPSGWAAVLCLYNIR